jgi:hypothetical protein
MQNAAKISYTNFSGDVGVAWNVIFIIIIYFAQ